MFIWRMNPNQIYKVCHSLIQFYQYSHILVDIFECYHIIWHDTKNLLDLYWQLIFVPIFELERMKHTDSHIMSTFPSTFTIFFIFLFPISVYQYRSQLLFYSITRFVPKIDDTATNKMIFCALSSSRRNITLGR